MNKIPYQIRIIIASLPILVTLASIPFLASVVITGELYRYPNSVRVNDGTCNQPVVFSQNEQIYKEFAIGYSSCFISNDEIESVWRFYNTLGWHAREDRPVWYGDIKLLLGTYGFKVVRRVVALPDHHIQDVAIIVDFGVLDLLINAAN